MSKHTLVSLIVFLALTILVVLGQRFGPSLLAPGETSLAVDPACNLQQGPCAASLPEGGRLELSITPRPLLPLKPLTVEVAITGPRPQQVEIEFTGVEMSMGLNRVVLVGGADGRFGGTANLPVCTTGRMLWQATVRIDSGGRQFALPFRFYSPP